LPLCKDAGEAHNLADLTAENVGEKELPVASNAEFEIAAADIASADTVHERALLAAITAGQHIDADDTASFQIGAEVESIACSFIYVYIYIIYIYTRSYVWAYI